MFMRRHVYEHNGGEVDQQYLDASGDTTVRLKQHIRETREGCSPAHRAREQDRDESTQRLSSTLAAARGANTGLRGKKSADGKVQTTLLILLAGSMICATKNLRHAAAGHCYQSTVDLPAA
jgi:hypothetical protein